ncbi:MAG TPA: dTDP-4-dehydrorhamnose 3,5-epimerase [Mycobacteriales bacterium]|nr:dTDP-4-dehydrorhamnose 3,5-epimerase [Mycobacteriales bacterium]
MDVQPLGISGAVAFTPKQHPDDRGLFFEAYKADVLAEAVGHRITLAQANCSVSRRGTVRGVHFAQVPPSQAKYVSCARGAILDIVIDIRVGSPTFGAVEGVRLDDQNRRALYIAEGLGHCFVALEEGTTVTYLCSEPYAPGREHGVTPTDPALGFADLEGWPADVELLLSPKDTAAPTLAEAAEQGLLPTWDACQELYASLRARG